MGIGAISSMPTTNEILTEDKILELQPDEHSGDMLGNTISARRIFSSQKGYMGMAPEEAREGDIICGLLGGEVPFVLRMNDDGHYYFIGEFTFMASWMVRR